MLFAMAAASVGGCGAADAVRNAHPVDHGPIGHLPVTPGRYHSTPSLGVLDSVTPYQVPTAAQVGDWQLALGRIGGRNRIAYRVPLDWDVDRRGKAASGDDVVHASTVYTQVREGKDITLPEYLSTLAAGVPVHSYVTPSGYTVYVLEREISPAPTDPDVDTLMFHTALVDIGGHIAKLELTYPSNQRFRFEDLSNQIVGTVDIQRSDF